MTSLTMATGPESDLTLTMDGSEGQLLRATGNLDVDVFGFVQLSGGFGIEKKTGSVTLNDAVLDGDNNVVTPASTVSVEQLLIGGSGLTGFIGAGDVGLSLSGVDFGLALLTETLPQSAPQSQVPRSWTSAR